MDNKVKLFAVASTVAVLASGCSGYRANQNVDGSGGYSSGGGTTQVARTGQVARGGLFGQRRPAATCTPCAAKAQPKTTYTYKPAPKTTYQPAPKPAGQHDQQYYIDRWNRQQAQQKNKGNTQASYGGYGAGNYNSGGTGSNTTYYDYSSAGKSAGSTGNTGSVTASNKSIYTGSYQQKTYKPYQPTTYAGGSAATNTTTNTTYSGGSSSGGSDSTYIVKKGDTVFEIMRQTGVYWKDIIKLNNLQAPAYNINPGQVIRLK